MAAPLLAQIGLPILIDMVGRSLSQIDHPVAQSASKALGEVETALAGGFISSEQMAEANRHAEKMAELEMKEFEASLSEINDSLRSEIASSDPYVRRMRPTFGYLMALTWAAQMFGLAYVVVFETAQAALVLEAMASLSTIWMVGLSVLGVYIFKRSEEKKLGAIPHVKKETASVPKPARKPTLNP